MQKFLLLLFLFFLVRGIIVALNNAGYDVGALIAGLGIGGIAFAMAAKELDKGFADTLKILARELCWHVIPKARVSV